MESNNFIQYGIGSGKTFNANNYSNWLDNHNRILVPSTNDFRNIRAPYDFKNTKDLIFRPLIDTSRPQLASEPKKSLIPNSISELTGGTIYYQNDCNCSSDYSKPNLNNLFSGILPSIESKPETINIKLRYNHQKTGDHDIWRLFVNGVENKVTKVIFTIPTDTTMDWEEKEQTFKAHISCNAKNVTFEKIENNIIAIVK